MYIRYIFLISKRQTNKQRKHKKKQEYKNAKETIEKKRISPENRLKNKFAAALVKIFPVNRISGNKNTFFGLSTILQELDFPVSNILKFWKDLRPLLNPFSTNFPPI